MAEAEAGKPNWPPAPPDPGSDDGPATGILPAVGGDTTGNVNGHDTGGSDTQESPDAGDTAGAGGDRVRASSGRWVPAPPTRTNRPGGGPVPPVPVGVGGRPPRVGAEMSPAARRREWPQIPRVEPSLQGRPPRPRPAPYGPVEAFAGPRLPARTSPLRKVRSTVFLAVIVVVIALILAAILAAIVGGIALGIHHASKGA
jgi:hypothetical protein